MPWVGCHCSEDWGLENPVHPPTDWRALPDIVMVEIIGRTLGEGGAELVASMRQPATTDIYDSHLGAQHSGVPDTLMSGLYRCLGSAVLGPAGMFITFLPAKTPQGRACLHL